MHRRDYLMGMSAGAGVLVSTVSGATVGAQSALSVAIVRTNTPVVGGNVLEVNARVRNESEHSASREIALVVDDERVDTASVTVDPGDVASIDLGYETYPVRQTVEFPVTVETDGSSDTRPVTVFGTNDPLVQRVRPSADVAVQPGTTLMFEVQTVALGQTAWHLDGEFVRRSFGPWYSEYNRQAEADYWQHTFESTETHEVAAVVETDDWTETVEWTVDVTSDGRTTPIVDDTYPSDDTIATDRDEPLEVAVSDPDGGLDRVVWWLGHADVILDVTSVSGAGDTASLSADDFSGCHQCPVVVWVVDEQGVIGEASPWTFAIQDVPLSVTITGTNDPVDAGDVLEVQARLENTGGAETTRDVRLVVGDDVVDVTSVSLAPGEAETIVLGYETYPVRQDVEFPVTVETDDAADSQTVEVYGTEESAAPSLSVAITGTNAPVGAGEFLEVNAQVENTGGAETTQDVRLVVSDDVVDSTTVSLDPGETTTVSLGYETYLVEQDVSFPVRVATDGDADERTVEVFADGESGSDGGDGGDPSLSVSIAGTNAPVDAGEFLQVTAVVQNTGSASATPTLELVSGGDVVDSASVAVGPGQSTTVSLGYETYPVERDVSFPVTVRGGGASASRTVRVFGG